MRRQLATEARLPLSTYRYVSLGRPTSDAAWPVAFETTDAEADGRLRRIELHADRVVLRRRIGGLPLREEVAYRLYRGLAIALMDPQGDDESIAVVLVHDDPALSLTLYSAPHTDDVVAEWRGWSQLLGLPMLVADATGTLGAAYPTLGRLTVGTTGERRRRRSALRHRRPSMFRLRAAGRPGPAQPVHRGERELSARE